MSSSHFFYKLFFVLRSLPRLTAILLQILICPPIYLFWIILLQPLRLVKSDLFWWLEGRIYDAYIMIVSSWTDYAGHSIYECGEDISNISHEEALVLVNHQSPTDIGTMIRSLQGKGNVFGRTFWIMDWVYQFFNFGWVSKGHGDFFLLQENDAIKLSKLFAVDLEKSKLKQSFNLKQNLLQNNCDRNRKWIILFPEGGFLRKRRSGSQRFAKKTGLPVLEHVALPRVGAVQNVVDTLTIAIPNKVASNDKNHECTLTDNFKDINLQTPRPLKWIIDVTIGYVGPISVPEFVIGYGGPRQVIVHYRCFPAYKMIESKQDEGNDDNSARIKNWMYNLYVEKEKLLSYFYTYHNFPSEERTEKCSSLRFNYTDKFILYGIQIAVLVTFFALIFLYRFLHFSN